MLVEYFASKSEAKIKKWNCACKIVAVGLSPTLDNIHSLGAPVGAQGIHSPTTP